MSVKLPFGLRSSDNCLVDVISVPNGAACGCVCPACDGKLIARNAGQRNVPHFAHGDDCGNAYETAIHETAKQIIRELGFVWLPSSILNPRKQKFVFTGHTLEKKFDRVVPDIMVWRRPERKLAVEIFVTHRVDDEKLARLRAQNLACVEFDLSKLPRGITYSILRELFENGSMSSEWIYNEKITEEARRREAEQRKSEAEELLRAKRFLAEARRDAKPLKAIRTQNRYGYTIFHVPECPRNARSRNGDTFANVELDCKTCNFCFGIRRQPRPAMMAGRMPPLAVICAGHKATEDTIEVMRAIRCGYHW